MAARFATKELRKHWIQLRKDATHRSVSSTLLISSVTLVSELMNANENVRAVIVVEGCEGLVQFCVPTCVDTSSPPPPIYTVTAHQMERIAGVRTVAPGTQACVAAEVQTPSSFRNQKHQLLVLDGVSDPVNTGTLHRSAAYMGWNIATTTRENTCDLFNDKALRASRNAVFTRNWSVGVDVERIIDEYTVNDDDGIYVADVASDASTIDDIDVTSVRALVLSNETRGVSEVFKRYPRVRIPHMMMMTTVVDDDNGHHSNNYNNSLNVGHAGAILMHALTNKSMYT